MTRDGGCKWCGVIGAAVAAGAIAIVAMAAAHAADGEDVRLFKGTEACSTYAEAEEALAGLFGEVPDAKAPTAWGSVVTLFRNPETESWTLVISEPNGKTCRITGGDAWAPIASAKGQAL